MTSPDILNFAELLAPIPGDSDTGIDLRIDRSPTSPYDTIREARMIARDAERRRDQGFDSVDSGLDAWRTIMEAGPAILTTQSKDLEIASVLTEGLLRFHGIAGLRDGFRLIRELVDIYWERLYPMPDDDGILTRLMPIINIVGEEQGADGTLSQPLRRIEIAQTGDPGPCTLGQYEQAKRLTGLTDEVRAQRMGAGAMTLEGIRTGAALTPRPFFTDLMSDVDQCIDESRRLVEALDRVAGRDAPSGKSVGDLLVDLREALRTIAPFLTEVPTESPVAASGQTAPPDATGAAATPTVTPGVMAISNREEAFAVLLRVAEYFRRAEPQSTISLVLDELVRRARLPLTELLQELIQDQNARRQFFVSAGIKPPDGQ
ncbi:MAG: type VI secretion system protein TssA [Stellaceae bacterium]